MSAVKPTFLLLRYVKPKTINQKDGLRPNKLNRLSRGSEDVAVASDEKSKIFTKVACN